MAHRGNVILNAAYYLTLIAAAPSCGETEMPTLRIVAQQVPNDPSQHDPSGPIHPLSLPTLPSPDPAWSAGNAPQAVIATIGSDERVIRYLPTTFATTGETVYRLVIVNTTSGAVRKSVLSAAGSAVDWEVVAESERTAATKANGHLSPKLWSEISALADTANVAAAFQYFIPTLPIEPGKWSQQSEAQYAGGISSLVQAYGDALEKEIMALGGTVTWRGAHGPFLNAIVSKKALVSVLAVHNLVHQIESLENDLAPAAMQWNIDAEIGTSFHINPTTPVWTGLGVRVAVKEYGNCPIPTSHPYWEFYNVTIQNNPSYPCTSDSQCVSGCGSGWPYNWCQNGYCRTGHGEQVVGEIGHHNLGWDSSPPRPGYRGAYRAWIHQITAFAAAGYDWAVSQGAWISNHSVNSTEPPFNWYSHVYGTSNFGSSMNDGYQFVVGDHRLASLTVGGYTVDPQYPAYGAAWGVASFANAKNPDNCAHHTGCDREYPHLVAHADHVETTCHSTYTCLTAGTSFAAPQVAGLAALMEQRWYSHYYRKPEAIKATLMTSSQWNLEGAPFSSYLPPDERDGAGIPDSSNIVAIADNNRVITKTQLRADYNPFHYWTSVYLTAGQKLRVTLAQSACEDNYQFGDSPHADLDLSVHAGYGSCGGGIVASSSSFDSEYEITEVTANTSGWYAICSRQYSWNTTCGGLGEQLRAAVAWNWY